MNWYMTPYMALNFLSLNLPAFILMNTRTKTGAVARTVTTISGTMGVD